MEIKKQIEEVLETLMQAGFERGKIEQDMGYSENYIDQTLSRGGNEKFLKAMIIYRKAMLQNTIQQSGAFTERLIQQIEARRQDAEDKSNTMKKYYEDAKAEKAELLKTLNKNQEILDKAQNAIIEVLKPIKEKTEELVANSNTALDRLSIVETIIRSDDTVIMNNQDQQIGNEVGKSAIEAGNRQLAADKMRKGKGSQTGARS